MTNEQYLERWNVRINCWGCPGCARGIYVKNGVVKNPVTGMREYGTHHQPMGTWSDDSSMALAELDSIRTVGTIDYTDMMERFSRWCM